MCEQKTTMTAANNNRLYDGAERADKKCAPHRRSLKQGGEDKNNNYNIFSNLKYFLILFMFFST